MKIVLSGVEGINKGAELMLHAILQAIEEKHPNAEVYVPIAHMPKKLKGLDDYSLELKTSPNRFIHFLAKSHFTGVLNHLGIRIKKLNNLVPIKDADYFIDASGLHFSDQANIPNQMISYWHTILEGYKKNGTKIIFLPQAFGPIEEKNTKEAVSALDKYADILMPRDKESEKYLRSVIKSQDKIMLFHDFTVSVTGEVMKEYAHKKYATIIPNLQMINKEVISKTKYVDWITKVIEHLYMKNIHVVLLDHSNDISLINECSRRSPYPFTTLANLNALEVKGVISNSVICITSRFHGLASALNTSVPCVTTSWNHKYKEILEDYGMRDSLLSVNDVESCLNRIDDFLDPEKNRNIRKHLDIVHSSMLLETRKMWQIIWNWN